VLLTFAVFQAQFDHTAEAARRLPAKCAGLRISQLINVVFNKYYGVEVTKSMGDGFVRISGLINVIAGVALLVYWYAFALFLPYRELSTSLSILVRNRNWSWINYLGVFGALTGLLGQAGIYVIQIPNTNWYASSGYYIATAGTTLLIGTMLWESVLWPILVKHEESLLDFQGPIYSSKTFLPFL